MPAPRISSTRMWLPLLLLAATARCQSPPWWERQPLRIVHLLQDFQPLASQDPAAAVALKLRLGFNAEHLAVMHHRKGLDDEGFYFASRLAGRVNEDYLKRYLPQARARGLRVMIYFNVHWFNREFASRHPDWVQITEQGRPLEGIYQTGTSLCVNSPWRQWVFQLLRDLCAYPIDGIFFDGPVFFAETCYCRHCREKYRRLYGGEMPSKRERRGRAFASLMEFQARSLADFLRDSRRVIKSINPQIAFYINGGVRGGNWATGRFNRVLVAEQDLLGSEGGFIYGDLTRTSLWKPSLTARLLETQAPNKPRVIFAAAAHKPWTFSMLPAPELRLLYADSIANGANVWLAFSPLEATLPETEAVAQMNRLVERNAAFFLNTRSEARVALVWSDLTATFYAGADAQLIDVDRVPARSEVGNLDREFEGLAESLVRAHVPFDVIDDESLAHEPIDRYALIVLPNVACMSEQAARRLQAWVEAGGNLLATFETSLYDETGVRRQEFALASLFGVRDGKRIVGPKRWDFMQPAPGAPDLLPAMRRQLVPAMTYHLRVLPGSGRPVLFFTRPLAGPYDGIPELSEDAAVVLNRAGRGRVAYVAGDLGNSIQSLHFGE
ncbi:MAG: beta-galactosidase trimerization domain-containing protein, partial [Bryobacteraceae bacterium]